MNQLIFENVSNASTKENRDLKRRTMSNSSTSVQSSLKSQRRRFNTLSPNKIISTPMKMFDGGQMLTSIPMPEEKVAPWNDISRDCLIHLSGFLDAEDIFSIMSVSKSWNSYLRNSSLRQTVIATRERYIVFRNHCMKAEEFRVTDYMGNQPDVTADMRSILTDWLMQVNKEFDNSIDTLFLTCGLVDRFLCSVRVPRSEVQLIGIGALMVASKMEETHYPDLAELLYLCDGIYVRAQLLKIETIMLQTFKHRVHMPHEMSILRYLLHEYPMPPEMQSLCLFLAELQLLDYSFIGISKLHIAVAIVCLVSHQFQKSFHHYIRRTKCDFSSEIAPVCQLLISQIEKIPTQAQRYVIDRYSSKKMHTASKFQFDLPRLRKLA